MKKIIALTLALVLALSLAACAGFQDDPNVKYASIIEDFVPDSFNMETLEVGQVHKPNAAIWCEGNFLNMVKTSSTDESVVTVTSGGKVTAVGTGEAYVIISIEPPIIGDLFGSMMYEIIHYEVVSDAHGESSGVWW